jgi:hypothetical protein
MRTLALLAALAIPITAVADQRDDVLQETMKWVGRGKTQTMIVSHLTTPGAEHFISQVAHKHYGDLIAGELVDAYAAANREPHEVNIAGTKVIDLKEFELGENYNWQALKKAFPGVTTVVRLSDPGFDRIATYALVRADLLTETGAETRTIFLEKEPGKDRWKTTWGTAGRYDASRRTDTFLDPPPRVK